MGSGSGQTQTQTQTRTLDPTTQGHLNSILGQAQSLYNSGAGTNVWQGPTVAGMNSDLTRGFDMTRGLAGVDTSQPFSYVNSVVGRGGIAPGSEGGFETLRGLSGPGGYGGVANDANANAKKFSDSLTALYNKSSGQNADAIAGLKGIMDRSAGPTAAETYLTDMARGNGGTGNPYLTSMLDANSQRIANRVNSSMSGAGRYGSGGHTDVLTRSIAEANNPILAQAYENDQNRRLTATGQIDQARLGYGGQGINAANSLGSMRQGDTQIGQNLITNASNVYNQGKNTELAALGGQTNAANSLINAYHTAQGQGLTAAGLAPQLDALRYAGADRLTGIGAYNQNRSQAELDNQRALFDQQNAMPWTNLSRYSGIMGGFQPLLGQGGTTQGTTETQTPLWQQIGGGLLGGAGLLGGMGAFGPQGWMNIGRAAPTSPRV